MTTMAKIFLGCATMALCAGSAQAADIADPVAFDWTGPYAGVEAGYGWGDTKPTFNATSTADMNYQGYVAGIDGGYNWQSGNLVFGLEGDASLSGIDGEEVGLNTPCIIVGIGCSADVDWLATGRLRMGFSIDRFMPFVTGGVAIGGVKGTFDSPGLACTCDVDDTMVGWTVGGGAEWAIDDRWSAKVEYLYVNLGNPSIRGDNTLSTPGVGTADYDFSVARMGVNFRF